MSDESNRNTRPTPAPTPTHKGRAGLWIEAARLRSLPLSLGGAFIAGGLAAYFGVFRWSVFALMLVTVVLLQVLSNFADEYGDLANGADNDERLGPIRAMQRGEITREQMKRALLITGTVAVTIGVIMIFVAFGLKHWPFTITYLGFAAITVCGAVFYTVGEHPYGYYGLGDIACFFFFGVMEVSGGFVLYALGYVPSVALPTIGCGMLVVGMININNMRDLVSDKAAGKRTFAVLIGAKASRVYQVILVAGGCALMLAFPIVQGCGWEDYLFAVFFVPVLWTLCRTVREQDSARLDRYMKPHSLRTALLCAAFALCVAF